TGANKRDFSPCLPLFSTGPAANAPSAKNVTRATAETVSVNLRSFIINVTPLEHPKDARKYDAIRGSEDRLARFKNAAGGILPGWHPAQSIRNRRLFLINSLNPQAIVGFLRPPTPAGCRK